MGERNVGTIRVGSIAGRGRDRSSNTSKATQPFHISICLPGSEIFPFFTCHPTTWCLGPRFSDTSSCKASNTLQSRLAVPSFALPLEPFLTPNHNALYPAF